MAKTFFKTAGQFLLNQGIDLLGENSGKIMKFVMNKAGNVLTDAQKIARDIGVSEKNSEKALDFVLGGIDKFVKDGPDAFEKKFITQAKNFVEQSMKEPKNQLLSDRSSMSRYDEPAYIDRAQRQYTDSIVPRRRVESLYAQPVPKVQVPKITKPQIQPRYAEVIKNQPEYIQSSGGNASFGDPRSELSDGNNPQVSKGQPAPKRAPVKKPAPVNKKVPVKKQPVKKRAPVNKQPAKSISRASKTGSPAKKRKPTKKQANECLAVVEEVMPEKLKPKTRAKPKKMVNVL